MASLGGYAKKYQREMKPMRMEAVVYRAKGEGVLSSDGTHMMECYEDC